ncbi:MAG TPA: hypothetical protein VE338_02145 [Ktedonobacterales bacterium]|jgi:hypothetical protein|nr:hypothetical protein [Ktedonobacterales bacterium]
MDDDEDSRWVNFVPQFLNECRLCNFVSGDQSLANPAAPCPNCGHPSVWFTFPDWAPIELLHVAMHFSVEANKRRDLRLKALVSDIASRVGQRFDGTVLLTARSRMIQIYADAGRNSYTDETHQQMIDVVTAALGVNDDLAQQIEALLFTFRWDIEENVALIVVVSTLLESMLSHLLVTITMRSGLDEAAAETRVGELRGFGTKSNDRGSYLNYFRRVTGLPLETALHDIGEGSYFSDWDALRSHRNDIIHGRTPLASPEIAEAARRLANRAVHVFAALQNTWGVIDASAVTGN